MTKEEYLSQVGELTREIIYHTAKLSRMRRDMDVISTVRYDLFGKNGSVKRNAPFEYTIERIEEEERQLAEKQEMLAKLQGQVGDAINAISNEKLRLVLLYKYLEGKSYMQIGDLLFVDKATAKRWQSRAMEELDIPEKPIRIKKS